MSKHVEFLRKCASDEYRVNETFTGIFKTSCGSAADYIEELEEEREFVKENIARRKEMEQMKGVEVSQLIAENAALREKVRLANEIINAADDPMHNEYCGVHDKEDCTCGVADDLAKLAAYRAAQKSEASNAK